MGWVKKADICPRHRIGLTTQRRWMRNQAAVTLLSAATRRRAYYTIFHNYNEFSSKSKLYVFPKTREN